MVPLLPFDSDIHCHLFWVAIGVLQLDDVTLYLAGLALLEQDLVTMDLHGCFNEQVKLMINVMMFVKCLCLY